MLKVPLNPNQSFHRGDGVSVNVATEHRSRLLAVLPVVCQQVQVSTYKLDTASVRAATNVSDVDALIKVGP